MSTKSDRDNRANQLNPNNSAYASSREGSSKFDDDDESYQSLARHCRIQQPRQPTISEERYFIAAVTFEGDAILGCFTVRSAHNHALLAESMRSKILARLGDLSELGVAYWRCASGWDRGQFMWYEPHAKKSELRSASRWMKPKELARANAWFLTGRARAQALEEWFDWRKPEYLTDFGLITKELEPSFSKHDFVELTPALVPNQ
jgi:hypothetical protein